MARRPPLPSGKQQLDGYLDRLGLPTGTLMLFDARAAAPTGEEWETRGVSTEEVVPSGRTITVLRL